MSDAVRLFARLLCLRLDRVHRGVLHQGHCVRLEAVNLRVAVPVDLVNGVDELAALYFR
jgi:hypothetical protein